MLGLYLRVNTIQIETVVVFEIFFTFVSYYNVNPCWIHYKYTQMKNRATKSVFELVELECPGVVFLLGRRLICKERVVFL